MKYRVLNRPSPNQNGTCRAQGVVLHHTCGNCAGSVDWCSRSQSGVSYHMIIGPDGTRYEMVPYNKRAWHAGRSVWRGIEGNSILVGVAWELDTNTRRLNADEIGSFIEWWAMVAPQYNWSLKDITTHRAIALPVGRKDDVSALAEQQIREALEEALSR